MPDTVRRYYVETLKTHLWKRIGQYGSQSVVFKFSTCMYTFEMIDKPKAITW